MGFIRSITILLFISNILFSQLSFGNPKGLLAGFEITVQIPEENWLIIEDDYTVSTRTDDPVMAIFKEFKKRGFITIGELVKDPDTKAIFFISTDDNAIEIRTPPLQIHQIKKVLTPIFEVTSALGFTHTTGGGHIHLDLTPFKENPAKFVNFLIQFHNSPLLERIFLPVEGEFTIFQRAYQKEFIEAVDKFKTINNPTWIDVEDLFGEMISSRGESLRLLDNTLEIRAIGNQKHPRAAELELMLYNKVFELSDDKKIEKVVKWDLYSYNRELSYKRINFNAETLFDIYRVNSDDYANFVNDYAKTRRRGLERALHAENSMNALLYTHFESIEDFHKKCLSILKISDHETIEMIMYDKYFSPNVLKNHPKIFKNFIRKLVDKHYLFSYLDYHGIDFMDLKKGSTLHNSFMRNIRKGHIHLFKIILNNPKFKIHDNKSIEMTKIMLKSKDERFLQLLIKNENFNPIKLKIGSVEYNRFVKMFSYGHETKLAAFSNPNLDISKLSPDSKLYKTILEFIENGDNSISLLAGEKVGFNLNKLDKSTKLFTLLKERLSHPHLFEALIKSEHFDPHVITPGTKFYNSFKKALNGSFYSNEHTLILENKNFNLDKLKKNKELYDYFINNMDKINSFIPLLKKERFDIYSLKKHPILEELFYKSIKYPGIYEALLKQNDFDPHSIPEGSKLEKAFLRRLGTNNIDPVQDVWELIENKNFDISKVKPDTAMERKLVKLLRDSETLTNFFDSKNVDPHKFVENSKLQKLFLRMLSDIDIVAVLFANINFYPHKILPGSPFEKKMMVVLKDNDAFEELMDIENFNSKKFRKDSLIYKKYIAYKIKRSSPIAAKKKAIGNIKKRPFPKSYFEYMEKESSSNCETLIIEALNI